MKEYEPTTKQEMKLVPTVKRILKVDCRECGEVKVWIWRRRCSFCDAGEGGVK